MKEIKKDSLQKLFIGLLALFASLVIGRGIVKISTSGFKLAPLSPAPCIPVASSVLTSALPVSTQENPSWTTNILGNYTSQIWSGDIVYSGTTKFRLDLYGAIQGQYEYIYNTKFETGILSKCKVKEVQKLICVWNDRFGSGTLRMEFSKDYSGFNGYWHPNGKKEECPWNGTR